MGTLERVMQMRENGQSDYQIIQTLQKEGISPKEINESMSQSQIKSELTGQNEGYFSQAQKSYEREMLPSMTQDSQGSEQFMQSEQFGAPSQEQYSQQPQQYVEYPGYSQQLDMETINEIAGQIVEEKTNQLKKQVSLLVQFKEEKTMEIENLNQRLLRIENTLNDLQTAIIGKIGEYGQDIKNIAKEMHMTQDSFSKIINPLVDKAQGINPDNSSRPKPKTTSKQDKTSFEDYLR